MNETVNLLKDLFLIGWTDVWMDGCTDMGNDKNISICLLNIIITSMDSRITCK
jgi:hypothetical protein